MLLKKDKLKMGILPYHRIWCIKLCLLAVVLMSFTFNEALATPYHDPKEQLAVDCLDFMSAADAYNFIAKNQWNELLGRVNEGIQKDPENPRLYDIRGRIYCAMKEFQLAEQDFNQAIQLAPKNPVLYEHRSGLYTGIGNHSMAASDRRVLSTLKPDWDVPLGKTPSTNVFSMAWTAVVLIVVIGVPLFLLIVRNNRSSTGTSYKAIGDR